MGGDSKSVRVLLDNGSVSEIPLEEATAVEFRARKPKRRTHRRTAAATAAVPPRLRKAVTVPAGTVLNVRLTRGSTSTLEGRPELQGDRRRSRDDRRLGRHSARRVAVVQAVQVQQSGKMKGSDKISLKLNAIGFGGMVYQVATAYVEAKGKGEGKRTARKIGGGAGLGAIVGGIAGGGEGAAIGAAVGGITGARDASRRRRTSEAAG